MLPLSPSDTLVNVTAVPASVFETLVNVTADPTIIEETLLKVTATPALIKTPLTSVESMYTKVLPTPTTGTFVMAVPTVIELPIDIPVSVVNPTHICVKPIPTFCCSEVVYPTLDVFANPIVTKLLPTSITGTFTKEGVVPTPATDTVL